MVQKHSFKIPYFQGCDSQPYLQGPFGNSTCTHTPWALSPFRHSTLELNSQGEPPRPGVPGSFPQLLFFSLERALWSSLSFFSISVPHSSTSLLYPVYTPWCVTLHQSLSSPCQICLAGLESGMNSTLSLLLSYSTH